MSSSEERHLISQRHVAYGNDNDSNHSEDDDDSGFLCNICLDPVTDPVVTRCGHLYCWSCLFRWLSTNHTTCPVCKAGVTRENVIPIFLGGNNKDPRNSGDSNSKSSGSGIGDDVYVPSRPQGQRPEPEDQTVGAAPGQAQISFTGNFGFFPSLFGLQFQEFIPQPTRNGDILSPIELQEQFLHRALLGLGTIVFLCFLFF
jgi:E3 ubiquitin-protein ligase RNF5